MPWPTYSERFLHHQAAGSWEYVVPEKMRAVVTNVDAISTVAPPAWAGLWVGPICATFLNFPVPNEGQHEQLRVVAYSGETVRLLIEQTGIHVTVSGYLFADNSGRTGPPKADADDDVVDQVEPAGEGV